MSERLSMGAGWERFSAASQWRCPDDEYVAEGLYKSGFEDGWEAHAAASDGCEKKLYEAAPDVSRLWNGHAEGTDVFDAAMGDLQDALRRAEEAR